MAKRFTESDLWKKEWFTELSPEEKCAYFYIKDNCDCVGVWDVHKNLADFLIKDKINWDDFLHKCNGNIEVLKNGKWFLVDFCSFQYGELTESCPPHRKYISVLKKHNLFERVTKGFINPIERAQEEEEEKEVDKEEEKETKKESKKCYGENKRVRLTDFEHQQLFNINGSHKATLLIDTLDDGIYQKGYKYKDHFKMMIPRKNGTRPWPLEKVEKIPVKKEYYTEDKPINYIESFDLSVLPQQVQDNLENFGGE